MSVDSQTSGRIAVNTVPPRTVGRLSLYRRILRDLPAAQTDIYSHDLASRAHVTAAQVRRDLMVLGYTGTPARGYSVEKLRAYVERFLFPVYEQKVALAGVGNIGRAVLAFFSARRPTLKIVASFEKSPEKINRLLAGCPCHPVEDAEHVIRDLGISIGIIAVPAEEAQYVADLFVAAGVRGILNFARAALHTPPDVYVENIDLAVSMDKVAYYARQSSRPEKDVNVKGES
jgi:redox-sensing transcriptional repressor